MMHMCTSVKNRVNIKTFSLIFPALSHCHYFHIFLGFIDKKTSMSIYTYNDNWNYIHMMCADKQNNVCLRQLVTYRKTMCVHAIFLFQ